MRHKSAPNISGGPAHRDITLKPRPLCLSQRAPRSFPIAAVEGFDRHGGNGVAVDTARIHAHPVWMRSRNIKGFHAAVRTEGVFREAGVESVGGQVVPAANQDEAISWNDQMQIPRFAANGAIAVRYLEVGRCSDRKAHSTTVTASGMRDHDGLVLVFLRREVVDQRQQAIRATRRAYVGHVFAVHDEGRNPLDAIALLQLVRAL